uniref:Uncharacterized protein n=1 Tax=Oryza brachyantha TaxID=4533 RepID=J3N659_ORYBR
MRIPDDLNWSFSRALVKTDVIEIGGDEEMMGERNSIKRTLVKRWPTKLERRRWVPSAPLTTQGSKRGWS